MINLFLHKVKYNWSIVEQLQAAGHRCHFSLSAVGIAKNSGVARLFMYAYVKATFYLHSFFS